MKKVFMIIGIVLIFTTGLGVLTHQMFFNNDEEIAENIDRIEENPEEMVKEETLEEEEVIGIGIGNIAPNFTLENIYGDVESLEDYRGKNIVLNFFRTT